jgi:hypothetical protein
MSYTSNKLSIVKLLSTVFILTVLHSGGTNGFVENKGQLVDQNHSTNPDVLFLSSGPGLNVLLKKTGYSYEIRRTHNIPFISPLHQNNILTLLNDVVTNIDRIDISFEKMNEDVTIFADEVTSGYYNYFLNGKEITHVRSFKKVTYKNIYRHTDIEFIIDEEGNVKYNIILHEGASIDDIRMKISGAGNIRIQNNEIEFITKAGTITEKIPVSYYIDQPGRNIPVSFILQDDIFSFRADHDPRRTFIIDPTSNRIWSTYYGDNLPDNSMSTGVDSAGNVYISGYTMSSNNIATSGSYQSTIAGGIDIFITKFNSSGTRKWSTYYGGANAEIAYAMFVEKNGNVYVCGDSYSTSGIASSGAHQSVYGGGIDDAILAKFNTNGQRIWSTYYGGLKHDIAQAITVDKVGNVLIAGHTESDDFNVIATSGALTPTYNLNYDAFIAKFTTNGARLWGTYYGEAGIDEAYGIACDTSNNVYITGGSTSIAGITTSGSHQQNPGGSQDGFIAKLNPTGNSLIWATYYGGGGNDFGTAIECDRNSEIILVGTTTSNNNISTPGSYQPSQGSADDAFIAKFSNNGSRKWGTYYGGEDTDYISDIVTDERSDIFFCGSTLSTLSISTSGGYQDTLSTIFNYDAYFAKFNSIGQRKLATYYGGELNDLSKGIAIDNTGKLYLTGETTSTAGISTSGAFNTVYSGGTDGFLAKFCLAYEFSLKPSLTTTMCTGTVTINAPSHFANFLWNTGAVINPLIVKSTTVAGTYSFAVNASDGFGCSGSSDTTIITSKKCNTDVDDLMKEMFMVYPSPADKFIHIRNLSGSLMEENEHIFIYSVTGQLVHSQVIMNGNEKINISEFPPGIYLLKLVEKNYSARFIKE